MESTFTKPVNNSANPICAEFTDFSKILWSPKLSDNVKNSKKAIHNANFRNPEQMATEKVKSSTGLATAPHVVLQQPIERSQLIELRKICICALKNHKNSFFDNYKDKKFQKFK